MQLSFHQELPTNNTFIDPNNNMKAKERSHSIVVTNWVNVYGFELNVDRLNILTHLCFFTAHDEIIIVDYFKHTAYINWLSTYLNWL